MPTNQTFIADLLQAYHVPGYVNERSLKPPTIDQLWYLNDIGLGPIAYRAYGVLFRNKNQEVFEFLKSADLTTRVIYKQMERATVELLASLNNAGITPAMLKGISTAYEYYTPPHLRLMGDVDILVQDHEVNATLAKLGELGYIIADQDWQRYRKKGHHHLPGARNPGTGVTIEVHTALIPPNEPLSMAAEFQQKFIEGQLLPFTYEGIPAARFTPEFQLTYTVSHWALDENWASNITSINDVIHILRSHEQDLDWSILDHWMSDNPWLHANLAALVNYLERNNLIMVTPAMQSSLAPRSSHVRKRTRKILFWLLHNYPFNAQGKRFDWQARRRAYQMWRELTGPNGRDIMIPYAVLRTGLRSIHHGKYNPIAWILAQYRRISNRIESPLNT